MGDPQDEHASLAEAPTLERTAEDSFDEVLRQVVRGPAAATGATFELAPGTELSGRFTIERVLGAGGMGTVYVARDRTLGRDVAIKLHHAAGGAIRLRREAIAMARLAHPNVVTVHEVGELERRPFVVMEYVAGTTLREWRAAAPRSLGEILAVLVAAGEGLAAAHDAGLVHRDIKPENVLIGSDGRARVGDFGLARELDSDERGPAVTGAANQLLRPMTLTGAVLGTPAYMAPEQFDGAPVEARADQFGFCVTAWEALWGERPFAGATVDQLRDAIASDRRRPPPPRPKVPAGVRAALERGLANDPAARFPTMHALLAALREPVRRRRAVVAIVAGATAIAGLAVVAAWPRGSAASCEDAGGRYTRALPRDLPAKLRAAGATEAAARVDRAVDAFADELAARARAGCAADLPPQLARNSDDCLAMAAQVAGQLLAVDAVTRARSPDIVERAVSLPPLDPCVAPSYLSAMRPLPDDPVVRASIRDARVALRIRLLERTSHDHAARDRLGRLGGPAAADPTVAAGVLLLRGRDAIGLSELGEASKLFSDAYYAARAIDDDELVAAALGSLTTLELDHHLDPAAAKIWARTALADAERIAARSPWLAGRLHALLARVADAAQDATAAERHLQRARALLAPGDRVLIDLLAVEGAVKMWSGHVPDGSRLYDRAVALKIDQLGATHPQIGVMLTDYASLLLNHGHPDQALVLARRAIELIARSPDPMYAYLDDARANLGAVLAETGATAEARAILEQARVGFAARTGKRTVDVAHVDVNLSLIYLDDGDHARAIEALDDAVAIFERDLGPDRIEVAEALFNLAVAHRKAGDHARALAAARRCAVTYARRSPGADQHRLALAMAAAISNDTGRYEAALADTAAALASRTPVENPQATAWPQLERARALIATRRFAEARPVLAAARATYAALAMHHRVDEIDALARKLR